MEPIKNTPFIICRLGVICSSVSVIGCFQLKLKENGVKEAALCYNTRIKAHNQLIKMTPDREQNTILIADDDPNIVDLLFGYLQRSGFAVSTAKDGASALEVIDQVKPDLILLDVMMPKLDGFEICRQLKTNEATKNVPIIFITALADIGNKVKGLELGAIDYITKPLQLEELMARLTNHLKVRELQKDIQAERMQLKEEIARREWILESQRESRERYRFLTENSTDMIARQDIKGIYRYVSPACQSLLGYVIEEMIGRSAFDFVDPEDWPILQQAYQVGHNNASEPVLTYRARRKDGQSIWLETTSKVIYNQTTGQAEEIITVSRDVTTRKSAEDTLKQTQQELEKRVRERTADLGHLTMAYGRFVPYEFLRFLEKESIVDVKLGDQVQHEMTILFADIRSFSTLSEQMTPQEIFNFLNSYLSRVSPIIRQHEGFIDKYMGDSIMALFPERAEDALQAAIAIQEEVMRYNNHRQQSDYNPIKIGIGFHTGKLMLGTIGEAERMEGTVVSDAVNLASRLEGLTKLYSASIIASEQALFSLDQPNRYHFRFLDRVQVKGKTEPVSVFEIFNGSPEEIVALKLKTRTDFEKGLLAYHNREFSAAQRYFKLVLRGNPSDKAAQIYLKRADYFIKYGVPINWEGVEALTEK